MTLTFTIAAQELAAQAPPAPIHHLATSAWNGKFQASIRYLMKFCIDTSWLMPFWVHDYNNAILQEITDTSIYVSLYDPYLFL